MNNELNFYNPHPDDNPDSDVGYGNESQEYPLVSAIMLAGQCPTEDILAAIRCFKAQTYPYKELIIVNNAKTQFEASKLNIHAQKDVFIIDTPIGLSAGMARNYGISSANGQILAQFDADYYHSPKRLEAQIATLAENEAHVSVLTETLQYSFISGRASYNRNDKNAILGTMVLVRPRDIDYPNVNKNEEKGFLEKLLKAELKVISIPKSDLACKLCLTKYKRTFQIDKYDGVSTTHLKFVKQMLKERLTN